MQVFVPYPEFHKCAEVLDSRRLNKQNLESIQLLDIMFDLPTKSGKPRTGWLSHPALIAWKHNPGALIEYTIHTIQEAKNRGFKTDYYEEKIKQYRSFTTSLKSPIWLGDELIHSSHRARLLQKGYEEKLKGQKAADATIEWYKKFGWQEMRDPDLMVREYLWATDISQSNYSLITKVSKDALKNKEKLISMFGRNPYIFED